MASDLDRQIAHALEAEVRLLPLLPELLADLTELGPAAEQVVAALESAGVEPGARALDLGCGKGTVAVALAERLGLAVEGLDAFPPFVAAARALAAERRVGPRCAFRQGDLRDLLGTVAAYDVVLLLSVGPVAGDPRSTVSGLRTLVRPGGHIVIEDGFLAEGLENLPGYEGYAGRAETRRLLTAAGDELLQEVVSPRAETRAVNERNTDLIRRRARRLKRRHPELAEAIDRYVARQEHETEVLGADVVCALWVLRRA